MITAGHSTVKSLLTGDLINWRSRNSIFETRVSIYLAIRINWRNGRAAAKKSTSWRKVRATAKKMTTWRSPKNRKSLDLTGDSI